MISDPIYDDEKANDAAELAASTTKADYAVIAVYNGLALPAEAGATIWYVCPVVELCEIPNHADIYAWHLVAIYNPDGIGWVRQ